MPGNEKRFFILFVCAANRGRSVVAEHLLRKEIAYRRPDLSDAVTIASAGIMPQAYLEWAAAKGIVFRYPYYDKPPGPFVIRFLERRGIDVSAYRSRPLDGKLVQQADLIISMDRAVRDEIESVWSGIAAKVAIFKRFLLGESASPDIGDPLKLPYIDQDTGDWDMDDEYEKSYSTEIESILVDNLDAFARCIENAMQPLHEKEL